MAQLDTVKATLREQCELLLKRSNVVAVGVGYKKTAGETTTELGIICSVSEKKGEAKLSAQDIVPKSIHGVMTDVVQTGVIRARQAPTERFRPAPGGVSIGHRDITAGTLGCLVKRNAQTFILSNNHVLANSNNSQIGDAILQPGPHDGGTFPDDHIANLADFVPISLSSGGGLPPIPSECPVGNNIAKFLNFFAEKVDSRTRLQAVRLPETQAEGDNLVDAAIAGPLNVDDVSDEILNIGQLAGATSAELGMALKKMGRTTGFTTGTVDQIDVTVNVQYGQGLIARFVDQIIAGPMSQGGDSGSAVLNDDNQLVGLLFAGSEQTTVINRIENVFDALRIEV